VLSSKLALTPLSLGKNGQLLGKLEVPLSGLTAIFLLPKNGDFDNAKTIDGNVNFVKSIGQTFDFLPEHLEEIITGEIIGDDIVNKELYLTLFGENKYNLDGYQ